MNNYKCDLCNKPIPLHGLVLVLLSDLDTKPPSECSIFCEKCNKFYIDLNIPVYALDAGQRASKRLLTSQTTPLQLVSNITLKA